MRTLVYVVSHLIVCLILLLCSDRIIMVFKCFIEVSIMLEGRSDFKTKEHVAQYVGPGFICGIKSDFQSSFASVRTDTLDKRADLVKGDKLHALPYWRKIIDEVSGGGHLAYLRRYGNAPWPCSAALPLAETTGSVWAGQLADQLVLPTLEPDLTIMSKMVGMAETKALANARKSFNNLPLLIAERRQTLAMIAKRVSQLNIRAIGVQRESLRRYFATRKRDRKMVAKDLANWHLETLFGWLPLIGEIEGLCDQLAESDFAIIISRGRMADEFQVDSDAQTVLASIKGERNAYEVPVTRRREYMYRHSARTSLRYRIDVAATQLLRNNGFNPVATVYDLTPLSFILDFCSNTGQWLRSYDPMFGATFETGSTTTWFENHSRQVIKGASTTVPGTSIRVETTGSVTYSQRGMSMVRTVHLVPPEPVWHLTNNLSLAKAATGAALVAQRYIKPLKALIKQREFRYRGPRPKYLPPIRYRR